MELDEEILKKMGKDVFDIMNTIWNPNPSDKFLPPQIESIKVKIGKKVIGYFVLM